jgi:hypothetical protein
MSEKVSFPGQAADQQLTMARWMTASEVAGRNS